MPPLHEECLQASELALPLEAGAEDVSDGGDAYEIICEPQDYDSICEAIDAAALPTNMREITKLPDAEIALDGDMAGKALRLAEKLEDHEDTQNVYMDFVPTAQQLAYLED